MARPPSDNDLQSLLTAFTPPAGVTPVSTDAAAPADIDVVSIAQSMRSAFSQLGDNYRTMPTTTATNRTDRAAAFATGINRVRTLLREYEQMLPAGNAERTAATNAITLLENPATHSAIAGIAGEMANRLNERVEIDVRDPAASGRLLREARRAAMVAIVGSIQERGAQAVAAAGPGVAAPAPQPAAPAAAPELTPAQQAAADRRAFAGRVTDLISRGQFREAADLLSPPRPAGSTEPPPAPANPLGLNQAQLDNLRQAADNLRSPARNTDIRVFFNSPRYAINSPNPNAGRPIIPRPRSGPTTQPAILTTYVDGTAVNTNLQGTDDQRVSAISGMINLLGRLPVPPAAPATGTGAGTTRPITGAINSRGAVLNLATAIHDNDPAKIADAFEQAARFSDVGRNYVQAAELVRSSTRGEAASANLATALRTTIGTPPNATTIGAVLESDTRSIALRAQALHYISHIITDGPDVAIPGPGGTTRHSNQAAHADLTRINAMLSAPAPGIGAAPNNGVRAPEIPRPPVVPGVPVPPR